MENSAMTRQDDELEQLRSSVNCGTILERLASGWSLDKTESTRRALKYRRGPGEIIIVNHDGKGWFDPQSDAKGDIFNLVQHLDPGLNFGHVRKQLRRVAGIAPAYPELQKTSNAITVTKPPAERWAARRRLSRGSPTWRYLNETRCLPEKILAAADAADAVREGPYASAWFAHRNQGGSLTGIEMRGPNYRGFSGDGTKTLFRLPGSQGPMPRLAIFEAPIDALSMAAFEQLRSDTLYVATAGGIGPATVIALTQLLNDLSSRAGAVAAVGTDNDPPGERHAKRLIAMIEAANVPWERFIPPGGAKDWNKFLQVQAGRGGDQ
jgi:hypothetical protein